MAKLQPKDVVLRRPARWEGWIPTFSGRGFYPITPKAEDVLIEDIAHGLAFKYRYGGHAGQITVAEHSLIVSRIIEILWPESGQMLPGLLHDACEAYTHDIQAPVRRFIQVQRPDGSLISWGDMERAINQTVAKALDIRQDFYQSPEVQAADILAAALEKEQDPVLQRAGNWGMPPVPSELKGLRLEYLSPVTARDAFLGRFHSLIPAMREQAVLG